MCFFTVLEGRIKFCTSRTKMERGRGRSRMELTQSRKQVRTGNFSGTTQLERRGSQVNEGSDVLCFSLLFNNFHATLWKPNGGFAAQHYSRFSHVRVKVVFWLKRDKMVLKWAVSWRQRWNSFCGAKPVISVSPSALCLFVCLYYGKTPAVVFISRESQSAEDSCNFPFIWKCIVVSGRHGAAAVCTVASQPQDCGSNPTDWYPGFSQSFWFFRQLTWRVFLLDQVTWVSTLYTRYSQHMTFDR